MLFSFGLMGASVVGLALTPSYASIGWHAPLLAVLFRLLQGFALGGEVGPTTAFLLESGAAGPARALCLAAESPPSISPRFARAWWALCWPACCRPLR